MKSKPINTINWWVIKMKDGVVAFTRNQGGNWRLCMDELTIVVVQYL